MLSHFQDNIHYCQKCGHICEDNICEICQYDLYGNLLNIYPSMTIAATAIKGSVSAISQVCSGKLKSHKNFIWKKLV